MSKSVWGGGGGGGELPPCPPLLLHHCAVQLFFLNAPEAVSKHRRRKQLMGRGGQSPP